MSATDAAVLFGLVAVLLAGGVGAYFGVKTGAFQRLWDTFKAKRAARQREREIGVEVSLPPADLLDYVVEDMLDEGWALQGRTATTATFVRDQGASIGWACCLALFFVVPAILYLLLYNTTRRVTVAAYPYGSGSRLVVGGDPAAARGIVDWVRLFAAGLETDED